MPEITELLESAQAGDRRAAAQLLPLVYDELRKLAAARMAAEAPGHTLDATALVHEAYLRLRRRSAVRRPWHTSSPPPPKPCGESWSITPALEWPPSGARWQVTVDLDRLSGSDPDDDILAVHEPSTDWPRSTRGWPSS